MVKRVKISWEGKVYEGKDFEEIMNILITDPWFGTLKDLKRRVHQTYDIELEGNTEEIFKKLEEIGQLKIL